MEGRHRGKDENGKINDDAAVDGCVHFVHSVSFLLSLFLSAHAGGPDDTLPGPVNGQKGRNSSRFS